MSESSLNLPEVIPDVNSENMERHMETGQPDSENARINRMGKSNASKQFTLLKYRAKVLNIHHDWDIVVMASHKHSRGTSFVTFGTPGLAEEFIGTKEDPTPTGKAVVDVFRSFVKQGKAAQTKKLATSTPTLTSTNLTPTLPATSVSDAPLLTTTALPPSCSVSPSSKPFTTFTPSTTTSLPSLAHGSSIPHTVVPLPSNSTSSTSLQPLISTLSPATASNQPPLFTRPSYSTPSSSTSVSSGSTTGFTNSSSSITNIQLPSDAVLVVDDKKVVAVGKTIDLRSVHGDPIPVTHQCISLNWAQDDYLAPYPLGNKSLTEILYFQKDMFYAVPHDMLRRLILLNEQYILVPFSQS